MVSISLCMIVKNEEDVLERCLSAVAPVVDEFVIVDTGTTDRTRENALRYADRLLHWEWIDDFSAARNFSFDAATQDYILWLDADDVITPDNLQKLLSLKQKIDPSVDAVSMIYELDKDEYGNVSHSLRRNRLIKRSNGFRWEGAVHEVLIVGGQIWASDVSIAHRPLKHSDPGRNLRIYREREARGLPLTARDRLYYAHELLDNGEHRQASIHYERFLADGQGWVEDEITVCGKLADCYHALGEEDKEWNAICLSFKYGEPRPEFCCRIGFRLLQQGKYETAAYWYKKAIELPPAPNWGLTNHACQTWLPHLQLCVCYDRLGRHDLAYIHNEIARTYRPNDPAILSNRKYLEPLLLERLGSGNSSGNTVTNSSIEAS